MAGYMRIKRNEADVTVTWSVWITLNLWIWSFSSILCRGRLCLCDSHLPPLENFSVFNEQRRRSPSQGVFSWGRPSQQRVQDASLDQQRPGSEQIYYQRSTASHRSFMHPPPSTHVQVQFSYLSALTVDGQGLSEGGALVLLCAGCQVDLWPRPQRHYLPVGQLELLNASLHFGRLPVWNAEHPTGPPSAPPSTPSTRYTVYPGLLTNSWW